LPPLRRQRRLAGHRDGRDRPDCLDQTKLIGFTDQPELARCEIATFRYRVLHIAGRITRGARQVRLRLDASWRWATAIAQAWGRIRTAFT
jgi:hypothetical protein